MLYIYCNRLKEEREGRQVSVPGELYNCASEKKQFEVNLWSGPPTGGGQHYICIMLNKTIQRNTEWIVQTNVWF